MPTTSETEDRRQQFDSALLFIDMQVLGKLREGVSSVSELQEARGPLHRRQLKSALEFYAVEDGDDSMMRHGEITQRMTKDAIDLSLPGWLSRMDEKGLTRIAPVAALRGGMGLVTNESLDHLRSILEQLGRDIEVEPWAVGVKRDAKKESAEVYFQAGYWGGVGKYEDTLAVIWDWGCATGATVEGGGKAIRNLTGMSWGQIGVMAMTMSEKARARIEERCVDEDGGLLIRAATRARLNAKNYVDAVGNIQERGFVDVGPKDWGDKLVGVWDRNDGEVDNEIEEFMNAYISVFGEEGSNLVDAPESLRKKYLRRYRSVYGSAGV